MERNKIIIIFVFIIAFFFRFYNLSIIPPHPSLDEVSEGYNANSIAKTGADEYGYKFPLLLRAYDDYRPALYTYLIVPFVRIFGLNVLSVRLPAVILSFLSVVSLYFLSKAIITNKSLRFFGTRLSPPIFITMLFAISPWDIYIGRLGHEVNAFMAFLIFALTFFFLYIKKGNYRYLSVSTILFALSFTAYQNGKVFIPIIVISLFAIYFKNLLKKRLYLFLNVVLGLILVTPILLATLSPNALIRFSGTNLFSDISHFEQESAQKSIIDARNKNYIGLILDNRRLIYPKLFLTAYFSHFNPFWLTVNSGDEQFKAPLVGLIYPYELAFIILGLYTFMKAKFIERRAKIFVTVWIISAVLPAAITNGYPHAMRSFQLLPIITILSGFGIFEFITIFKRDKIRKLTTVLIGILLITSCVVLFKNYFMEFPVKTAHQFQYGISDAYLYTSKMQSSESVIYVSNKDRLFQSYMFYLFFSNYDPKKYQREGGTVSGGYAESHIIGKYFFTDIGKANLKNSIAITNPHETVLGDKIKTIYYPDGKEALWIVRVK